MEHHRGRLSVATLRSRLDNVLGGDGVLLLRHDEGNGCVLLRDALLLSLSLLENRGGIPSMERALSLECQRCRDWGRALRIWGLAISAVGLHRQGADESCRRC